MLFLIVVSLVWAFSFPLIKFYLTGLPSSLVASIRFLFAILFFIPFTKFSVFKDKKLVLNLLFLGSIQYGIMYISYIYSYQFLHAYEVALLTIFTPLFIILIDFLYERQSRKRLFSTALAIIGAGIIVFKGFSSAKFWLGFLFAQVANLSFAFGQVFYKRHIKPKALSPINFYIVTYIGAFIVTIIPVILGHYTDIL